MTTGRWLTSRTALITGAGSGIGRSLAVVMARRGLNLALVDVDQNGLAETMRMIGTSAGRLTAHPLDLVQHAAIAALPDVIRARHGRLDILVNNAGVAVSGHFEAIAEDDFDWLFSVNFVAMVRMTRAFLPLLRASDRARIVNISSLFGLIAMPGQTAYAASKFAVRGFSEALRHELSGTSVGMTVVHPGGVATSIVENARASAAMSREQTQRDKQAFTKLLTMSPDHAAETIVRGIERQSPRVIIGGHARFAATLERLFPVRHVAILLWLAARTQRSPT